MSRNLQSSLRRRRRQRNPMNDYDALPQQLRRWLQTAVLPWSPSSARGIWLKSGGTHNPEHALARLDTIEAATLLRDRTLLGTTGPNGS